jgi:phage terminase large subunit-like protein
MRRGAPAELDQFARFCGRHLRLEDGRPLEAEEFQRRMLTDFFAGTTETLISVSKKNGKSTLIAAGVNAKALSTGARQHQDHIGPLRPPDAG